MILLSHTICYKHAHKYSGLFLGPDQERKLLFPRFRITFPLFFTLKKINGKVIRKLGNKAFFSSRVCEEIEKWPKKLTTFLFKNPK